MAEIKLQPFSWWRKPFIVWQALRRRYWLALGFDVAVLVLLFWGINVWQSRHLLPSDGQLAPPFHLTALDGSVHDLEESRGKTRLVYFFAPWCHVCNLSAPNINALRRARRADDLAIYMVALSYSDLEEVQAFQRRHDIQVPILLGDRKVIGDYHIRAFPTYYVIGPDGALESRAVGYSTELGLRWRT